MLTYREDRNMGLPSNFELTDGKFTFTGGVEKAQDNMRMIMHFVSWFREYRQDFCVDIFWLLQKPGAYLETFKNIYLSQFIDAVDKYAQNIKVSKSNLNYQSHDRKQLAIGIEYFLKLAPEQAQQFLQIIER